MRRKKKSKVTVRILRHHHRSNIVYLCFGYLCVCLCVYRSYMNVQECIVRQRQKYRHKAMHHSVRLEYIKFSHDEYVETMKGAKQ